MRYKKYTIIFILLLFPNCTNINIEGKKSKIILANNFTNKGFTVIYNEDLYNSNAISNKIDDRSLVIFQKNLKKNTQVKITNILNGKSLIAIVGKKSKYPLFNNSVISKRIADSLDLNPDEPYIQIFAISENSLFIAKKAKTFDEEKKVAAKAPVKSISINDLNEIKIKKTSKKKNYRFSYTIKIADFYFKDTALIMIKRIQTEVNIQKPKVKKISDKKYRVYLGPFNNINSLQKSFNDIKILEFENIEIIKND
jgi:hypothetical protein